jgi:hypothetical protein
MVIRSANAWVWSFELRPSGRTRLRQLRRLRKRFGDKPEMTTLRAERASPQAESRASSGEPEQREP